MICLTVCLFIANTVILLSSLLYTYLSRSFSIWWSTSITERKNHNNWIIMFWICSNTNPFVLTIFAFKGIRHNRIDYRLLIKFRIITQHNNILVQWSTERVRRTCQCHLPPTQWSARIVIYNSFTNIFINIYLLMN